MRREEEESSSPPDNLCSPFAALGKRREKWIEMGGIKENKGAPLLRQFLLELWLNEDRGGRRRKARIIAVLAIAASAADLAHRIIGYCFVPQIADFLRTFLLK